MKRSILGALAAAALVSLWGAAADADLSEAVQKKFKGQILIAADPLPSEAEDDAETIRQLKKASNGVITHAKSGSEGVAVWRFHFIAFMDKKPGVSQVALDFYTDDKKKEFVAQERLAGIDGKLTLLQSEAELSEDDGLSPNRAYVVKLTAEVRGREVVLATTKLRTK